MKWLKITAYAQPEAEELLSDIFLSAGAQGVDIQGGDISGAAEGDYVGEEAVYTGEFNVSAYFAMDGADKCALETVQKRLDAMEDVRLETQEVDEENWANAWKAYFKPVRVSEHVVIKPTWEDYVPVNSEIVVQIDPGMAFGTGTHESTRMCVQLLEAHLQSGDRVIDVGCGSGILTVAALRLGAAYAQALDFDSVAVQVAGENLELNHCTEKATVQQSDLFGALAAGEKADVVLANIIADIIIKLAPEVPGRLEAGGTFICSGIIDSRLEEVEHALEANGLEIKQTLCDGEWRALACGVRA